jgi:hypothetical protein
MEPLDAQAETARLRALIHQYLATRSTGAADRFAAANPSLRTVRVMHAIVTHARRLAEAGDETGAEVLEHAVVLLGCNDLDGIRLIHDVFETSRELRVEKSVGEGGVDIAAVARALVGHPALIRWHRSIASDALGHAARLLGSAGEHDGDAKLLREAVDVAALAVDQTAGDSPDRAERLRDLRARWAALYGATHDQAHLHEATAAARAAAACRSDTRNAARILFELFRQLFEVFAVTRERQQLDDAIAAGRQAVLETANADPLRGAILTNLAAALDELFVLSGNRLCLEEALSTAREAVVAFSPDDPDRRAATTNLAAFLARHYEISRECAELEEAISLMRDIVASTPSDDPAFPGRMHNLAVYLRQLHEATGDRRNLEEAVITVQAVVAASASSNGDRPAYLNSLANVLADFYRATGQPSLLGEAVVAIRDAIAATATSCADMPLYQMTLANRLAEQFEATEDLALLDQAIDAARMAVDTTPMGDVSRPGRLNNLSVFRAKRYQASGHKADLHDALDASREAVAATPSSNVEAAGFLNNLANHLADMYEALGDHRYLKEAQATLATARPRGPEERGVIGWTRAMVARHHSDLEAAVGALRDASIAFADERERLRHDSVKLRDLSVRTEGLLSDLAACLALIGSPTAAVEAIEAPRTWLAAPTVTPTPNDPKIPVAWVMTSRWETVVISTHLTQPAVIDLRRDALGRGVAALINGTRVGNPFDAVDVICEFTSRIVSTFPEVEDLLIVPVGLCAMLPYAAGRTARGEFLIERSNVTVAPTRQWAAVATRPRPEGPSFAAFHPGTPSSTPLDLHLDEVTFRALFPKTPLLTRPHPQDVLPRLRTDGTIAHFSCHGRYEIGDPLHSSLELAEDLTLKAILTHNSANWLVNLSACETGICDVSRSEQVISFPTGFVLGGAAHVIGTLWPVGNAHASEFNRSFYEHVILGRSPAEAHRHAINKLRLGIDTDGARRAVTVDDHTMSSFNHPYWWAPFMHYGSPR